MAKFERRKSVLVIARVRVEGKSEAKGEVVMLMLRMPVVVVKKICT